MSEMLHNKNVLSKRWTFQEEFDAIFLNDKLSNAHSPQKSLKVKTLNLFYGKTLNLKTDVN